MERGDSPSVIHLYLYQKIRQRANGSKIISYSDVLQILKRNMYSFPRIYYQVFLKEMEDFKLIKKRDRLSFIITGNNKDKLLNKYTYFLWDDKD